MEYIAIIAALATIAVCARVVFSQRRRRYAPLFSYRNIFLAGFVYFQVIGLFFWLANEDGYEHWSRVIRDQRHMTSFIFSIMLLVFTLVFLATYRYFPAFKIRINSPRAPQPLQTQYALLLAFVLTAGAITLWLLARTIGAPHLGLFFSAGMGSTGVGFACWAWCNQIRSIRLMTVTFMVAAVNVVPHLTGYGRRGILSLGLVILWVLFYRFLYRHRLKRIVIVAVLAASPAFIFLAAFSEARVNWPKTTAEAIKNLQNVDLSSGVARVTNLQNSTVISLWCIENHPDPYDYRPLYSLRAFFHFFIPRSIWPAKPEGLGIAIPSMARMRNVGDLNVGAGLIGHAAAEGGILCLIVYAIVIGIGCRYCDYLVATHPTAFWIIPMGAALGELFALSRGELNYFADILLVSAIVGLVSCRVVARVFRPPSSPARASSLNTSLAPYGRGRIVSVREANYRT